MSLTMHDATVPVIIRQLDILTELLAKGEAHAAAAGIAPSDLLEARLAPDMHPFVRQVQIASDTAKGAVARLTGETPPSYPDDETDFAALKERLAKTSAYVRSIPESAFEGSETRAIALTAGPSSFHFTGRDYLFQFVLPNLFFHLTTAYGLLRHKGVPVGKRDFLSL